MKRESGFTLIELLLVLAIIGIISAIAIPALLGQRARARDKASMSNLDGIIADGIGQWDKYREQGASPTTAMNSVASYIKKGHTKDVNPWNGTSPAYGSMTVAAGNAATVSAFLTGTLAAGSLGQVKLYGQPSTSTLPGFMGGMVLLHGTTNGSLNYRKAAAVE
jgi:prepilin-type N-terminal cleavage/methylation domain-containing protein